VQITTARLELRVMELEDTITLMTKALHSMNEMVSTLNEIIEIHTRLLTGLAGLNRDRDDALPELEK
jgi:hypothetical protein